MLVLQNRMNIKAVGEHWIDMKLSWDAAIADEVAELIQSLNYKWWKDTKNLKNYDNYGAWLNSHDNEIDLDNIKIEVIDLWHFHLSKLMDESNTSDYQFGSLLQRNLPYTVTASYILSCANSYNNNRTTENLLGLTAATGMTFSDVYKLYVGKNVLNMFRQDNGYANGTYQKMWGDVEDNVHMQRFLDNWEHLDSLEEDLQEFLSVAYNKYKGN